MKSRDNIDCSVAQNTCKTFLDTATLLFAKLIRSWMFFTQSFIACMSDHLYWEEYC